MAGGGHHVCDLQAGFGNPGGGRSVLRVEASFDSGDGYWRIGSMDVTCFGLKGMV